MISTFMEIGTFNLIMAINTFVLQSATGDYHHVYFFGLTKIFVAFSKTRGPSFYINHSHVKYM